MAGRRSRQRQAKLSFSPAAQNSRHAHVSYVGSPSKRRRIDQWLQADFAQSDGPSSSAIRAEQAFPLSSQREQTSTQKWTHDLPTYQGSDSSGGDNGDFLTDSDTSHDSLVIKKARQGDKGQRKSKTLESSQIFSKPPIISPKQLKVRSSSPPQQGSKPETQVISSDDSAELSTDDEGTSDESVKIVTPKRARSTQQNINSTPLEAESDSDNIRPSTQRLMRRNDAVKENVVYSVRQDRRPSQENVMSSKSEDEDVAPILSQRQRKRITGTHGASHLNGENDDEPRKGRSSRRSLRETTRRQIQTPSETENAESESLVQRPLRKRHKSTDLDEQAEIDEDAEDLKVSTVFRDEYSSRKAVSKRGQRLNRLEQLKAKRSGKTSPPQDVADEVMGESSEQSDPPAREADEADESDSDSWVVDENSDAAGDDAVEDGAMTDLELMRHVNLKPKDHWECVIRWMLSARLNPGGAREIEPFYKISMRRVNQECQGLIDRLISSSWVPVFIHALKARPEYEEAPIDRGLVDMEAANKCSACNRSGHPATYTVRLTGKAYSSSTLEPLKDEDDEDDEDEESEDEAGHRLVDEGRIFQLGKTCRSNAMNAHALLHWRVQMRDWIQIYLKKNRYLKSKRIVERESWSTAKRERLVDSIMNELRESGSVRDLWKSFEEKLAAAPNIEGQRSWR